MRRAGNAAAEDVAKVARDEGRRLSQGPVKAAKQKEMDGPFAKRHGSPRLPTEVINKQSGLFARSWVIAYLHLANGQRVVLVYNAAPYAEGLENGTRFAFSRPVDVAIELRVIDTAPYIVRRRAEAAMSFGPFKRT
ncbi:hypothetical protein EON81_22130 [bacterium]|nr:MAG: hypothetical protein EON81_22130 [bacterium]